ncbi:uncharacterized protein FSUBG_4127 [Fusarium subglutinans]|uniref:Uncharacterized protein n=1 Tax=Gibberella subglutinans TaxID=42677 RepID=A0A8H5V5S8_GIBSU|nr:uncharacterized protein FSUBG_4127 [Fusarium subglutinans]KAF5609334.1 hypothetical protein FSUBG_4127 [Fusarium subglutinans]
MQLVQLIPERGFSRADLSPARFAAIAQGALSMGETLQLVHDVLELGPRLVYVFIDNLTIAVLCRLKGGYRLSQSANVPDTSELEFGTKICFTTEGYVDGLAQVVEPQLLGKVEFDLETNEAKAMEVGEALECGS